MDVRAFILDMCKKRKANVRVTNVVVSSEEEEDSARLEQPHKKRIDCAGPFVIVVVTLTFSVSSSPFIAHMSSPGAIHVSLSPVVLANSPFAGLERTIAEHMAEVQKVIKEC